MEKYLKKLKPAMLKFLRANYEEEEVQKRWLMHFLYFCADKWKKRSDRKRGKQWGNTWEIRINPEQRATGFAYCTEVPCTFDSAQHAFRRRWKM